MSRVSSNSPKTSPDPAVHVDPFPDVTREELVEFAIHMGIKIKHYWHKYKLIDVLAAEIGRMCAKCPLGVLMKAADPTGAGCDCPGVLECPYRSEVSERELGMRKVGKERYGHGCHDTGTKRRKP